MTRLVADRQGDTEIHMAEATSYYKIDINCCYIGDKTGDGWENLQWITIRNLVKKEVILSNITAPVGGCPQLQSTILGDPVGIGSWRGGEGYG